MSTSGRHKSAAPEAGGDATRTHPLLQSTIVWDNHGCMPLKSNADFLPQLKRYRDAGVTVVSINVGMAELSLLEHLRILSFMRHWIAKRTKDFHLVSTVEDIARCKTEGKLGIVFDIEGMYPVQDDLSFVQTFYELGVRWMLVAYNRNNAAGGGCLDTDTGLTDTGRRIIDEMEQVGMVLCLSHTGAKTAAEALEYAHKPVIFSHSNPYGDTSHVRNISDQLMRACARTNGVIGLNGFGPFLGARQPLVDSLLRQIRYAVDLVGPDHVGLALDYVFDQSGFDESVRLHPNLYPPGMNSAGAIQFVAPEAMSEIAEGLARTNWTDREVHNILGGNWLRVARQVWQPGDPDSITPPPRSLPANRRSVAPRVP